MLIVPYLMGSIEDQLFQLAAARGVADDGGYTLAISSQYTDDKAGYSHQSFCDSGNVQRFCDIERLEDYEEIGSLTRHVTERAEEPHHELVLRIKELSRQQAIRDEEDISRQLIVVLKGRFRAVSVEVTHP